MGFIGLSVWHSDILFLLYFVLFCLAFRNIIDRKAVIDAVGLTDAFVLLTILTVTYVTTASYTRSAAHYGTMWRLIHKELIYIRKTYGVLELRLVFHFLIKRVQIKSFYGNEIDVALGVEIVQLIKLWSHLVYREIVTIRVDDRHRVRVIYLEKIVKRAIKKPFNAVRHNSS